MIMTQFRSKKDGSHYPINSGKAVYPKEQYRIKRTYSVLVDADSQLEAEQKANYLLGEAEKIKDFSVDIEKIPPEKRRIHPTYQTHQGENRPPKYKIGQKVHVATKMHDSPMGSTYSHHDGVIKFYNNGVYLVETSHGDAYAVEDELTKL